MISTEYKHTDRRVGQAKNVVLIALLIAFASALLGFFFTVKSGSGSAPDAWLIGLLALVSGGLTFQVILRPAMATRLVTGMLTVYFAFHLNAGAIIVYDSTRDLLRTLPYLAWFFPLVAFHQLTNFGFYKRPIGLLVGLGPIPTVVYILAQPEAFTAVALDAVLTLLFAFFAFVLFFSYFTRHRDEEVERAARAQEADRSTALLRVSDERFKLLGIATSDLIWDADLKSDSVWWSDALHDCFGYDRRKVDAGMAAWRNWIHPDDREQVVASLDSVMESGDSKWNCEHRFMHADGRTLDVVARGLVLRDDEGEPVRLIGSMTDVTDLRGLEMKLRQSQKMEAVGQLTGGIAHDFNNLLTIVLGSAEMLAELRPDDPEVYELAQATLDAAERGAQLTQRLLAFARRQTLSPERRDPGELLAGLQGLIRRTIDADIEIAIRSAADTRPIEVDSGQLENAVLNLAINARDAMPDGGKLTIECSNVTLEETDPESQDGTEHVEGGLYVLIAVSDNGTGMSKETIEHAFEPFFTSKGVGKGSGLGLAMVWGFVRQSRGHARIYSELGEGTTIKLYFPVAQGDDRTVQDRTGAGPLETAGGTEHVLVVEDDHRVRKTVAAQLRALGYVVSEAEAATDALQMLDRDPTIELLFTDVVMPGGMNGKQLADVARKRRPELAVLFTSGYTEDAIVHQGRLEEGVILLGKPYSRADLIAKLRSALDGAHRAST